MDNATSVCEKHSARSTPVNHGGRNDQVLQEVQLLPQEDRHSLVSGRARSQERDTAPTGITEALCPKKRGGFIAKIGLSASVILIALGLSIVFVGLVLNYVSFVLEGKK